MTDPNAPRTVDELDVALSEPRDATVRALAACSGDIVVLGAGGKMGPTLARMAARAARAADGTRVRRVIAVSRFTSGGVAQSLHAVGIETVACDLLDRDAVRALPDAPNVIFMAGQKFGTTEAPERTWLLNVVVPAICADRYATSRIVAFSTGNVYPLTFADSAGAKESDEPGPVGEYAASCLARERIFEGAARNEREEAARNEREEAARNEREEAARNDRSGTARNDSQRAARNDQPGARVAILRLNYAIDLRYGVLADLAGRIVSGESISLAMGFVNVIWQGDANRAALELLPHAASPALVVNVTGVERLSVRWLATELGARLGREPVFAGIEAPDALLSDASRMRALLGAPEVPITQMLDWTAEWTRTGGERLGKPTHFDVRDGKF